MKSLIIGTRGSPLALAQTILIKGMLEHAHPGLTIETIIIKTSGDLFGELSLVKGGGKGLFTKEIEEQLLDGAIHMAVHSMKDLPTSLPVGLCIGATPVREDARDAFISKRAAGIADLPAKARVATSSLRRRAQLLARRPDLQVEEIRGNVGTRLRKLAENVELEAMILAAAGLKRLGLYEARWPMIDVNEMIPAVGQGIIGIEVREDDRATRDCLSDINNADAFVCAEAERAFLHAAGGGCQLPYAGHAVAEGSQLRLVAAKFSPDGTDVRKTVVTGEKSRARELGEQAAREISQ
jgi:hydroxymethylbilane synthase